MKINVELDATPEELRRFFGMPDVQPLQDEMIQLVRERMHAGTDGYDPVSLLGPLMPAQFQNMEALQKMFWESFSKASGSGGKDRK